MIHIRRATISDAWLIARLAKKSFIESHGHSASEKDIGFYVSTNLSLTAIRRDLNSQGNIYHLIYYKKQPAGFSKIILYQPHQGLAIKPVAKLERLYLLERFYGLGLGYRLFRFLVILCKQKTQQGMWLFVWKQNERAIKFYKQSGFTIAGTGDFKISETHSNPNYLMLLSWK
ncbi:MAG TPA: GNAT family N-acetyltransferase [Chitinophagaceae bacterium]|jgi:ribosomal protein S18 acetylase RimI-like enzyme|nr:GNAT family N-acetyltransferase [Chitinophagaceae bacterium]